VAKPSEEIKPMTPITPIKVDADKSAASATAAVKAAAKKTADK